MSYLVYNAHKHTQLIYLFSSVRQSDRLTVDKLLLLVGNYTGEVSALHSALALCVVPVPPMGRVLVAVALEFMPAIATCFSV